MKVPSLTEKDEEDEFAIKQGVDSIAVSAVQTAEDVRYVKRKSHGAGVRGGVGDCRSSEATGQWITWIRFWRPATESWWRGDLGVEVPPEKVPAIQKHADPACSGVSPKPVITAQMLESMN